MTATAPAYVATLIAAGPPATQTVSLEWLALATLEIEAQGGQSITIRWHAKAKAVDLAFSSPGDDLAALTVALRRRLGDAPVDCIVQPMVTRRKRLLVADLESTMIEQEMLDELAGAIGQRDRVAAITTRAMNGELDFAAALRERVALLRGQPAALLDDVARNMTEMPGAAPLIASMQAAGAVCWLVTGGFSCFAEPVARRLGFDAVHANRLLIQAGVITGEVAEPILDKHAKRRLLDQACAEHGIAAAEALAVGDGANDVPMLMAAGLGVAYRAKPAVRATVAQQINHGDLTALLYAQGLTPVTAPRS